MTVARAPLHGVGIGLRRELAQELLVTVPPLLEILAGM